MASYRDPGYRLKLAVQENNLALVVRLRYKTEIRNTDSKRLTSLAWAALSGSEDVFEWLLFDAGHDEEELSRDQDNSTILHLLATLPEGSPSYTFNTFTTQTASSNLTSSTPSYPFLTTHLTAGPNAIPGPSTGPGTSQPHPYTHHPASSSFIDVNGSHLNGTKNGVVKDKRKAELFAAAVRMTNMYLDVFPHLIDWSNAGGKTALHTAAQSGNVELVRTLCEMGADLDLTDLQGNTPMHYASAWNHLSIVRILLEFGSFAHQHRNNASFLPSDYAFSLALQKEMQVVVREVQEERKLRRKASSLAQQQGYGMGGGAGGAASLSSHGGARSPVGSSYGFAGYDLRTRESRATLMSEDGGGGRSPLMGHNVSPAGGQGQSTLPELATRRNESVYGPASPASLARVTAAPPNTPPLVQIQLTATRNRSHSNLSSVAPPVTPRKELLTSPSTDRVRGADPGGSPLTSPSGSSVSFRPPLRPTPSRTSSPGMSPVPKQGSFRDASAQAVPKPILRHAGSSETGAGRASPRAVALASPSKVLDLTLGSPTISRGTTPTPANNRGAEDPSHFAPGPPDGRKDSGEAMARPVMGNHPPVVSALDLGRPL